MLGLGQQLRSAREAQGLTLGEASAKIHIRAEYLGALEAEQWSTFADPIYVRGFLRTYAHFLELRAEVVVAQYNEIAPVGIKLLGPDSDEAPKKGSGRISLIFAMLILFGGMGFAGYAFVTHAGSLAFALPNVDSALPAAVVIDATPEAKLSAVPVVNPTAQPATKPTPNPMRPSNTPLASPVASQTPKVNGPTANTAQQGAQGVTPQPGGTTIPSAGSTPAAPQKQSVGKGRPGPKSSAPASAVAASAAPSSPGPGDGSSPRSSSSLMTVSPSH